MLPSGKFPRTAVGITLAIAVLLLANLLSTPSASQGFLFANILDFAMVFWAAMCAAYAARRSAGYLRQLWSLLALGLSLESIAQILTTYYQRFQFSLPLNPWPSDVLFFIWPIPVFVMFLPQTEDRPGAINWPKILDYGQVGIVTVTAYLYFFYIPSQWRTHGLHLEAQILSLYMVRDVALAACFLLRANTTASRAVRTFSRAMAVVFATTAVSHLSYLLTLSANRDGGMWKDALWAFPYAIVAIVATGSSASGEIGEIRQSRVGDFVISHVLPIGLPLAVILMGKRIAEEQVSVAMLAVTASFLCSAIRLILTNRSLLRTGDELRNTEKALRSSEQMFASAFRSSPDSCSISLFPESTYVDVNEGFTRLTGYSRSDALGKTPLDLQLWLETERRPGVMQELAKTGTVVEVEFRFRRKDGAVRNGLYSATLAEIDGRRCALVVVRDVTEQLQATAALRESEERFRTLVEELHAGVVLQRPDATIEYANRAALQIFGFSPEQVLGKRVAELGLAAVDEAGRPFPMNDLPVMRVLREGQPVRSVVLGWRRLASTDLLWIYGNTIPQFDEKGNTVRVITTFSDITDLKNAEKALHRLSTQLLQMQDQERRRIGRELHDGLAQTVLAVNLNLAQVRESTALGERSERALEKARSLLQEMAREIRTLSYLLHPPLLDDLGLVSALKEYVHGFGERSGINTEVVIDMGLDRLPQDVETTFFRIVQESLANVQRHSGSATARLILRGEKDSVCLEIIDEGRGIAIPLAGNNNGGKQPHLGVGIPGMRERMSQLGGTLEIVSSAKGTTVRARLEQISGKRERTEDVAASDSHRG